MGLVHGKMGVMNTLHEGVKSWHDLSISLLIFLKSNFMMYSAWCVLKLNYSSSLVHERVLCLFWGRLDLL